MSETPHRADSRTPASPRWAIQPVEAPPPGTTCDRPDMTRPRILLADDHAMLLAAFQRLLAPTCDVVGTVADGRALLEAAPRLKPDVIVLDISMPLLNGIDACRQLQPKLPDTRWVFLTVNEDPDLAVEAFRLGASGFLLKSSAASELFSAIEMAMEGKPYITPLLTKGVPLPLFLSRTPNPHADKLTARQREVVQLLAEGRLMKEVADILGVTPRTVAFHKYTIMRQLGLKTTAELVQYAVKHGIVRR
jgi:DNA-binding NarL/FixJ family response regulator